MKKYMTGGVANPNAKVTVLTKATSKGSGNAGNETAKASNKATGKSGRGPNSPASVNPKKNKK